MCFYKKFRYFSFLFFISTVVGGEEITPYKFTDVLPSYDIPASSRFAVQRSDIDAPDIVYYLSKPSVESYPIAIVCGGSSLESDITSIIHLHRYFLQEFLDLGVAVVFVEQRGVDGKQVAAKEFMQHYTRSYRLHDHQMVIDHLKINPPKNWNGKIILLGISEGGPIVTKLTIDNADMVVATMNWSGAGGWTWADELWIFLENIRKDLPWYFHYLHGIVPRHILMKFDCYLPVTRQEYHEFIDLMLHSKDVDTKFMGMTYRYHQDALTYPVHTYSKIKVPYLMVAGVLDSAIASFDDFAFKAQASGVDLTYKRIEDMGHYIRRRPDVIEESFVWLQEVLDKNS